MNNLEQRMTEVQHISQRILDDLIEKDLPLASFIDVIKTLNNTADRIVINLFEEDQLKTRTKKLFKKV